MSDEDQARKRIHQLLLSGDNTLKNRDDDIRIARARERFVEARTIADAHGLDPSLVLIDRRLELLDAGGDEA